DLVPSCSSRPLPPPSTLFPYTTLFRSAQRVAKFADSITASLEAPMVELFRQLIEEYQREHDVPMVDIAAALATQSRDGESFLLRSEEHTSELQSRFDLVCRLLLEKKHE